MKQSSRHDQKGYIALIAVVIITAVTLAISLSLNVLSIDELQISLLRQESVQSQALAQTCLEEAYGRLRQDNDYSGGSLNIGDGSCTISIAGLFIFRRITVAAQVQNVERRLQSMVSVNGTTLQIYNWQEIN